MECGADCVAVGMGRVMMMVGRKCLVIIVTKPVLKRQQPVVLSLQPAARIET